MNIGQQLQMIQQGLQEGVGWLEGAQAAQQGYYSNLQQELARHTWTHDLALGKPTTPKPEIRSKQPDGSVKREPVPQKETSMFGFNCIKDWTNKHKDALCTIGFVFLVDWLFLGGALRHKLKAIADELLNKAQRSLSHVDAEVKRDEPATKA